MVTDFSNLQTEDLTVLRGFTFHYTSEIFPPYLVRYFDDGPTFGTHIRDTLNKPKRTRGMSTYGLAVILIIGTRGEHYLSHSPKSYH